LGEEIPLRKRELIVSQEVSQVLLAKVVLVLPLQPLHITGVLLSGSTAVKLIQSHILIMPDAQRVVSILVISTGQQQFESLIV
jgi:hypothetical protein